MLFHSSGQDIFLALESLVIYAAFPLNYSHSCSSVLASLSNLTLFS
jgi:hypothetical protein